MQDVNQAGWDAHKPVIFNPQPTDLDKKAQKIQKYRINVVDLLILFTI